MNLKDKKNTLWRNLPLTAIHVTPTTSFCYELRANQRKETTDPLSVIINSTQYMLLLLQNNTGRGDVKNTTKYSCSQCIFYFIQLSIPSLL